MTDRELNDHLAALVQVTSKANERLRGVRDALAVIQQTADRTLIKDPENIDPDQIANQHVWRKEASLVSRRTTLLLWQAASLLNETAKEIRPTIELSDGGASSPDSSSADETAIDGAIQNTHETSRTGSSNG